MQYQYAPLKVYTYKQDLKECFPKTSLEGLTTWSKMVKIVAAAELQWREVSRTNNLVLIPHSC